MRFGEIQKLGEKLNAEAIPADATSLKTWKTCSGSRWKPSAARSTCPALHRHVAQRPQEERVYRPELRLDALKLLDIFHISFHKVIRKDVVENGCHKTLGLYSGADLYRRQRTFPDYNEMADSKSFAGILCPQFRLPLRGAQKVRKHHLPSRPPKPRRQRVKGFDEFFDYGQDVAIGQRLSDACADYCILLFSDLTRMVTMQNLYHDGGFSSMGRLSKQLHERLVLQLLFDFRSFNAQQQANLLQLG